MGVVQWNLTVHCYRHLTHWNEMLDMNGSMHRKLIIAQPILFFSSDFFEKKLIQKLLYLRIFAAN
jgi:hypothetical protein